MMRVRRFNRGGLAAAYQMGGEVDDSDGEVMDPDSDEMDQPSGAVTASGGLPGLDIPGAQEAFALMAKSSADARKALQQARAQIMSRKYNRAQMLLAASAALGAPTRAGSAAESFGAMAGALRGPLAERDAFEQQKTDKVLGIDTQLAGLDDRQAQAQLALAQLRAKLAQQGLNAPNDRVVGPDGVVRYAPRRQSAGQQAWVPEGTKITNDMRQESAENKKIGEGYADQFLDLQKGATAAQRSMSKYDRFEELVKGAKTGKFAPTLAQIASIGEAFGFKIDPRLGPVQAADALSKEMALALRNPALGEGMPGALSDQDREYLQKMVPGLSQTTEGNKLIIETFRKLAARQVKLAKLARDYRRKNGHIDEGLFDMLETYADENPIFGDAKNPNSVLDAAVDEEAAGAVDEPSAPGVPGIPSVDEAAAAMPGTRSFHSLGKRE